MAGIYQLGGAGVWDDERESMTENNSVWKNRITGYGVKKASQFTANPLNFRKHPKRQKNAVVGSLDSLGWVDVVIENTRTGFLVDGHERIWDALKNDDSEVPYITVDLTEAEEAQALLSLDPIAAMAATDASKVDELLRMVNTDNAEVMKHLADFAKELNLDEPQFKEYDESIADGVEVCKCPTCGHEHAKKDN